MNKAREQTLHDLLGYLDIVRGPTDSGRYICWCPFHADGQGTPPHQPNLHVSEKGFICHACGEKGGLPRLSEKLGVKLRSDTFDEITFDYCDEHGTLLFQVVRRPGKKFLQRRPDGTGGWIWKLGEVRRVLYRLPDLVKRLDEKVWIVEGEKDTDRLASLGLLATTNAGGAGKWRQEYSDTLAGRDVVIVPDHDQPGHQHAEKVARSLEGKAASVRILPLPDLRPRGDVSDWLNGDGTVEQIITLAEEAPEWEVDSASPDSSHESNESAEKKSMAAAIIGAVEEEGVELFHEERHEPFARVAFPEGRKIMSLASKGFERWLSSLMWNQLGKVPSSEALRSARNALEGKACHEGLQHKLSVRVARQGDAIWIDLDGVKAVKVTEMGWEVVDEPPTLFRPLPSMKQLPIPLPNGDPFKLLKFTNIRDENTAFVLLCYLVAALVPEIAIPALIVHGVQGAAKTSLFRLIRRLIDPSRIETRGSVKDEQEFALTAWQNRCLFFDNLTGIPAWLSNAICRAVTGDGWSTRTLYTNEDTTVFEFQRILGLAGINQVARNADLLDRSIIVELDPIPISARRPETEFWKEFDREAPAILGGLLDALVVAMRTVDKLRHEELPRMADFARWGAAAAVALGRKAEDFKKAYSENVSRQSTAAVEASPVAETVVAFMEDNVEWEGTVSMLYGLLKGVADNMEISIKGRDWPGSPGALSRKLKEAEPPLRGLGIEIEAYRTANTRTVRLSRIKDSAQDATLPPELRAGMTTMTEGDNIKNNVVTTEHNVLFEENFVDDDNDDIFPELPPSIPNWSDEQRDTYEERAAIVEYDGGFSREESERKAQELVQSELESQMVQQDGD